MWVLLYTFILINIPTWYTSLLEFPVSPSPPSFAWYTALRGKFVAVDYTRKEKHTGHNNWAVDRLELMRIYIQRYRLQDTVFQIIPGHYLCSLPYSSEVRSHCTSRCKHTEDKITQSPLSLLFDAIRHFNHQHLSMKTFYIYFTFYIHFLFICEYSSIKFLHLHLNFIMWIFMDSFVWLHSSFLYVITVYIFLLFGIYDTCIPICMFMFLYLALY